MGRAQVKEPWEDMVDIADWSNEDLEQRNSNINMWDKNGEYRPYRDALADEWGINPSASTDRSIRLLLWKYLNETDQNELREKHSIVIAIPPVEFEWEPLDLHPEKTEDGDKLISNNTLQNIDSILNEIIEQEPYGCTSKGQFAATALIWAATGDILDRE